MALDSDTFRASQVNHLGCFYFLRNEKILKFGEVTELFAKKGRDILISNRFPLETGVCVCVCEESKVSFRINFMKEFCLPNWWICYTYE